VAVAFEHGVTPADLIGRELATLAEIPLAISHHSIGRERSYLAFETSRMINAWGKLTNGVITALEVGTLMHCFNALALLPLEGCITPRELLAVTRRWCPICFEERIGQHQRPYEPLIWHPTVVTVCLAHAIELIEVCPGCKNRQLPFAGTMQPGCCTHCHEWLGRPDKEQCTRASSSALEDARQIGELIIALPTVHKTGLAETLNRNVFALVEGATRGNFASFRSLCGFQRWEFSGFPEERPSLEHLLRICKKFDLKLTELFEASFAVSERCRRAAASVGARTAVMTNRKSKKKSAPDLIKAKTILEKALNKTPAPNLCVLARRIGWTSPQIIRKHFPELFEQLKARAHPDLTETREQQRRKILSLVPEAHNLTVEDVERMVGLSYIQMCQRFPKEYRSLAERLRRPHREAVEARRERMREYALEVAKREFETGIRTSLRQVIAQLPNDCMKASYEVSEALREARSKVSLNSEPLAPS
jgi:hypothetical protein